MSDGPSEAPRDPRPRPRYGEYAPEGWVSPVPVPEKTELQGTEASSPPAQAGPPARPATPGALSTGRRVDRVATLVLLGLAVYNVVGNLVLVPRFSSTLLDMLRTGGYDVSTFTSQEALQQAGAVIAVVSLVVLVATLWWSVRRLRAGRLTFFVPLAAGVLVTIVQVVAVFAVFWGDAAFVQSVVEGSTGR